MATNKSSTSSFFLWLQVIVGLLIIAWLSYDFYHSLFNGMTYTLRMDNRLQFSENSFAFFIAVVIKLAVYVFFIQLVRDCVKKLRHVN